MAVLETIDAKAVAPGRWATCLAEGLVGLGAPPVGVIGVNATFGMGTVAGMAGTMANLGVMIFTLLIGALVTQIGYTPFFIALAVFDLVAAAILWTLVVKPGTPSRESGWIPILLGGGTAAYLGWHGIGSVGVAGYVGFGFGLLLLILGIAIELRARRAA